MSSILPTLTALLSEISFFEVMASLIVVGLVERGLNRLPEEMVGPGGWLLDTGPATEGRS